VALTIDDGTCASCVDRILDVVEATGGKVTLFPNGMYRNSWEPQAKRIRDLVAKGQVTLGNHTYSHGVSTQIGPTAFAADLERNEDWIPWPPRSRAARATSLTPLTTGRDPGPSS
jgi:peptidoglycan-N-acetylglucosamine deacetylase